MFLIYLHCLNDVIDDTVEALSFSMVTKCGNRSLCTNGALDFFYQTSADPFQYNFTEDILYKV